MATVNKEPDARRTTADELRRLPANQRDAILEAAAALAEADYLHDPSLTAFEAYGEEDRHGESADAETR